MSTKHSEDSALLPNEAENSPEANTEGVGAASTQLEALAQTTLDAVRHPLLALDDQLRIRVVGRAFCKAFRVTPAEAIGRLFHELGGGQWNIPRLRQSLEAVLEQNQCIEGFEVIHEFERLGPRTMSLSARRVEDVGSGTRWILLAIEDITEGARLQEEIQSARLAEAVLRTTRDPMLILEADQRVHMANEAFYGTFKLSAAETEGRSIYDLGNGEWNIPMLRRLLGRVLPEDQSFDNLEVTDTFEPIGVRTLLLNGCKLAGGPPERILLGIRDITKRKQDEAAQARLAAIVESSEDAIASKDLNGVITSWNRAAERLFGYTAQEMLGQPVTILIPPGRWDEEPVILERIRRGERIEQYETVRRRKDGSLLDVSLTVSPIIDRQGQIIGASKIIRDITERKEAERTLALLAAVSQDLVHSASTDEIMESGCARLAAHLDVAVCNLIEIKETTDKPVCTYRWNCGDVPGIVDLQDLDDYLTELYLKAGLLGELTVVRDTATDPQVNFKPLERANIQAFISVPLEREGRSRAAFSVLKCAPYDWRDEQIALVRDVAMRLWTRLEQVRAEEALRQAVEFDEAVMMNMGEGLYTVDDQGLVTFMNPAAEKLLGWKLEELRGKKMHDMTHYKHPDGRPFPAEECAGLQVLRLGTTLSEHEDVFISKDGNLLDVVYSSSALREGGRIRGLVVVFRDVTERKRSGQALQKSEQRFSHFMQHLPGLAWIKDQSGRYVYANDGAELAFGIPRADLYGKTDQDLFPAETAEQFMENDRRVRSSLAGIQTIEALQQADGTVHHSIVSKFPIPGPEGQPSMVGGVAFDVTEQKRAEEALRESEARFRLLADSAPVLIWLNGLDGCEFVNREFLRFLGRTMEEVQGMTWATALHPEDAEPYVKTYLAAYEARDTFEAQFRFRRVDGEYRWMKSSGLPRFAANGEFLGYVGCSFDITDIKQYQQALSEADHRKNEFLAMLAHELRNPLAPIRNALEILRLSGGNAAVVRSAAEMIDRQIAHMTRLVDDLLDVSRITRGKIELRTERIELAPLVNDAVEAVRPYLDKKGLHLTVKLPLQPVSLTADPVRLTQVIGNLLNNALKFTGQGGSIWLTADVARHDDDSQRPSLGKKENGSLCTVAQAVIRVRDTGIGMTADQLPHIFDMFFQVDTSLERRQSGLGIGLMLAKNLIELHGGTLEGQSAGLGQGSEFVIKLPLGGDELSLVNGQKEFIDATVAAQTSSGARMRRILVVDDNVDSAESLTMLLKLTGNETRAAFDGLEALESAATFHPDIILLDIGLPELNGYEVARKVREQPWGKHIILIALTGWGQKEDRRRSREAGFDHHLTKPVDLPALKVLLAQPKS